LKTKAICLVDVADIKPGRAVAERSYRRGCHQTAARIAAQLARMNSLMEALDFLEELTDVLSEFRHDNRPHLALLDEALSEARRRTAEEEAVERVT
jgi:hypothetical protein